MSPRLDADAALAAAYLGLEGRIADLRRAASVVRLVVDDVLEYGPAKKPPPGLNLERLSAAGQLVFVLTEEEYEALDYAVEHLCQLARGLDTHWQEQPAASAQAA